MVSRLPEGGRRLAGRSRSGGEARDDPGSVDFVVLGRGTEEDLIAQVGDQPAEFGHLPGDGDDAGQATVVPRDRELAALGVEGRGHATQG